MAVVVITSEAQRQYHELPRAIRARIEKVFIRLRQWPDVSGAKPLTGNLAGYYRIRTGDYRVQFRVLRDEASGPSLVRVKVEKVGHRDRFYED